MKVIEIRNLKVKYRILKPFSLKNNIFSFKKSKFKIFEAIKGIDLDVEAGEIVGLIGDNGSGKSTLLKCIAGVFSPDEGTINNFGNSISLLALGIGFQRQLSGRENIYLSGLLSGHTRQQIEAKEEEIIEFSELGEFINMPVSSYSSGMYSKLAFSISSIMESDILLLDEIFSVGDAKFKKKSAEKMKELIYNDSKTIILVSHTMPTIRKYCDKVVWLKEGSVVMAGAADEVVTAYEKNNAVEKKGVKTKK